MDFWDQYIDRVTNLPPAPTVAKQLLRLFDDEHCDIDRVVELISLDPSLTAIIPVVMTPLVTRFHVNHAWRAIGDRRWTVNDWWRPAHD